MTRTGIQWQRNGYPTQTYQFLVPLRFRFSWFLVFVNGINVFPFSVNADHTDQSFYVLSGVHTAHDIGRHRRVVLCHAQCEHRFMHLSIIYRLIPPYYGTAS